MPSSPEQRTMNNGQPLTKMKAAVLYELNQPVIVEELELEKPKEREVLVKMIASGVCHSDLSVTNGTIPLPLPIVLGHEGAGIVEEVGPGVTAVKPGDHVVLSWVPQCGRCSFCAIGKPYLCDARALTRGGTMLDGTRRIHKGTKEYYHMLGVSTMATYTVVPEISVVRIDSDIPLREAALIGCGVMTGVGAVINTAKVEPGSRVAVFGAGGVGLNVIQGAVLASAEMIIAIDLLDRKLQFAKQFGATHLINASTEDPVQKIKDLTGGGVDYAFEVIGQGAVITQAYQATRRGGTTVVIGVAAPGVQASIPANTLVLEEKTLKGSYYGSARVQVDIPKLTRLYKAGRLKLGELISHTYPLEEINKAFEDLQKGENARGVLVHS
jgi:S-(hydroxymethyl)glutathione dehydrogenase/alcohol dehydrogenase